MRGEGARMVRRHNLLLHPKIQTSENRTRMAPRRSPRLHPQIQANEEGAGVTYLCRRHSTLLAEPASLPGNDDMLWEILLRLPPQPSSLLRGSAVCKRWRWRFLRCFHAHHRKPPLLGFFERKNHGIMFKTILDPPDRVPPQRFDLGCCSSCEDYNLLDCHHGLVLVKDCGRGEFIVCDPITRKQHRVAVPPEFKRDQFIGAVHCVVGNQGHVHDNCHSSPFNVVLVSMFRVDNQHLTCVYFSETGEWGYLISIEAPSQINCFVTPATLVGNVLYWLFNSDHILEFDLGRQNLVVTMGPPVKNDSIHGRRQIIQAEDGALGFAILAHPDHFQTWQRNINGHGVSTWVLWKTIEMQKIIRLPSPHEGRWVHLLGYDEDDVAFLCYAGSVYMVNLKSMESKKHNGIHSTGSRYFPFKSFFTPAIAGGFNGAGILHVG